MFVVWDFVCARMCAFLLSVHSFSRSLPERLAVGICIFEAHLLQLTASVQLIVAGVGLLPQILHVDPDQHLSELYEVAVTLILNWGENTH